MSEPLTPAAASSVAVVSILAGPVAAVALYDIDPDTVAALVLACPTVAGLSGGPFGAAATYLAGRKVAGIQIRQDTVEVHVVARYGATVSELAGQVRAALAGQVLGRTVDIVVEDVDLPATAAGVSLAALAAGSVVPPAGPFASPAGDPVHGVAVPAVAAGGPAAGTSPATPTRTGRWTRQGRQA